MLRNDVSEAVEVAVCETFSALVCVWMKIKEMRLLILLSRHRVEVGSQRRVSYQVEGNKILQLG